MKKKPRPNCSRIVFAIDCASISTIPPYLPIHPAPMTRATITINAISSMAFPQHLPSEPVVERRIGIPLSPRPHHFTYYFKGLKFIIASCYHLCCLLFPALGEGCSPPSTE